jgi:hypothetical protein
VPQQLRLLHALAHQLPHFRPAGVDARR